MKKKLLSLIILTSLGLPATAKEDNLLSNVIVSLDANQIRSVAAFADGYAISTQYTYNHVFSGFSAAVTPKVLARLSTDQRVLSISNDGRVHAIKNTSNQISACNLLLGCQTNKQITYYLASW